MDVTSTHDVLYVSTVADPDLDRAMRAFAQRVGTPLARPHVTREVAPRGHADVSRSTVDLAVACWLLGGFLLALVLALVRPAWSRGRTAGVLLAAGAILAVVVALVVSARGGPFLDFLLLGLATTITTSAATTALVSLLGLVGAAIASTVFVFLTAPLFTGHDPRLLPSPWRQVAPWTPHGATSDLATSLTWYDGRDVVRPMLVLGGYLVVGLVAWAVALAGPSRQALLDLQSVLPQGPGCARSPWRCRSRWRWWPPSCSPRPAGRSCPRRRCRGPRRRRACHGRR